MKYGWDKKIINPHASTSGHVLTASTSVPAISATGSSISTSGPPACTNPGHHDLPSEWWKPIKHAFPSSDQVPQFNNGHIIQYFVTRSVIDGLPSGDLKSINLSAVNLFQGGHVQHIEVCSTATYLYLRASCLPEMRKDRIYKLALTLNSHTLDIIYATCGCPAGKGPSGSCKHISALCYAFAEFCKCGAIPGFLTCTDKLQSWNKPRSRKVDPIPVDQLTSRRNELTSKDRRSVVYDPRPHCFRKECPASVERLRCDLLDANITGSYAFLTILVPTLKHIQHDHTYALPYQDVEASTPEVNTTCLTDSDTECEVMMRSPEMLAAVEKLCIGSEQRELLEMGTREQNNDLWHEARRYRITGSKCGRILMQKTRTVALLRLCLYPKPFSNTPRQIQWGRNNEPLAREAYVKYMNHHGHPRLSASVCGFFVHPQKGWLGASPDAKVFDPDTSSNGIAEFKCPFSKADDTVEAACEDPHFYCKLADDGRLTLVRNHQYYHQVQLQLYTSLASWCDFCVYTSKNLAVEQIYPDCEWQQVQVTKLDTYFHECMLPEIVCPKVKPHYFL